MRSRRHVIGALFVLALPLVAAAGPKVIVAPLVARHPLVGQLAAGSERGVMVSVRDERPHRIFTASGLVGPDAEKGKGVFLAYATQKEDELAPFITAAARDAVRVVGIKDGGDHGLEIVVRDFRVGLVRFSGFSPMNCIGYGRLTATLKGADGAEVKSVTLDVAFYDGASPKWGMKEVSERALSRMYSFAAWQAVTSVLRAAWNIEPDRAAVKALVTKIAAQEDEDVAREMIFWLGLLGQQDEATSAQLLAWVGSSKDQKVYQSSAVALGMLGVTGAAERLRTILSGKNLGEWDPTDNEQCWHLIHALALLGEKDLQALMPKGKIDMRSKIDQLIGFDTSGTLPEPGAVETKERELALKELAKQRK